MTNLIKDRLREIIELQNSVAIYDLNYSSKKKNYSLSNNSLPVVFLRDIYEKRLSKNNADKQDN